MIRAPESVIIQDILLILLAVVLAGFGMGLLTAQAWLGGLAGAGVLLFTGALAFRRIRVALEGAKDEEFPSATELATMANGQPLSRSSGDPQTSNRSSAGRRPAV